MKLLPLVALAAALPAAHAHHSIWTTSMYGVGIQDFAYTGGDPVIPIGPGVMEQDNWWFRGPAARALKPIAGAVSTLVAGGKFTVEIACHIAWTSLGWRETVIGSYLDACPENVGAYHAGDPNGFIDESLVSGCALGIADVDSIEKVTMENLAIFSVQARCVRNRVTTFDVPAAMPKCTGSKCICAWFWLANNGSANFYMTGFDCNVVGSPANARPISAPINPGWCPKGSTTCFPTPGAKRPLYAYNSPSNVIWRGNDDRPGYHRNWGFLDGAQNDIFEPALVVSSTSVASVVPSTVTTSISVTTHVSTTSTTPSTTTSTTSSSSTSSSSTTSLVSTSKASGRGIWKPSTTTSTTTTSTTTQRRGIAGKTQAPVVSKAAKVQQVKRTEPTPRHARNFMSARALDPEEGRAEWVAARVAARLALSLVQCGEQDHACRSVNGTVV